MDDGNAQWWRRVREHFGTMLDLAPSLRARRIDEIAVTDAALADALRTLLAQLGPEDEVPQGIDGEGIDDLAGTVISDRFRLLHRIGSGGMGDVYLATRTDDLDKRVALKLMRSDLPVPMARARREQQILARLAHPNIAGLIDAGVSAAGQPWFAMDHVDGERITDWCDRKQMDLTARARLMASVCRAVQYAHRNLILHRDIKPSNILVDVEGEPRLLDFGIAKLLDGTDAQQTQTLALTPAYAAPEQLRGEPATTASDIYQLGLLLFELLAGVPARGAQASHRRGLATRTLSRVDQAFDHLVDQDPARARMVASRRDTTSERLHRALRGDPGRIVGKAMAEDPRERYETAQELADDLDRWASGFPVRAHRGTFGYRLSKLVRRHRIAAAIITMLAGALMAISVVALRQARAEHAQRLQAEAAGERADRQRRRAETLLGFMNDVFRQADPQNAAGVDLTAEQMLERASANLAERTDLDPVTRAALMIQVADTFNALFLPERALSSALPAIAALEPIRDDHADEYLRSVVVASDALQMLDRGSELLALVERALPLAERAAEALPHWRLGLLKYRGAAHCSQGEYRQCAEDLRRAVDDLDPDSSASSYATVVALNQLAVLTSDQGNASESARLLKRALALLHGMPSALSADISTLSRNLISAEHAQGRFESSAKRLDSIRGEAPALYGADVDYTLMVIDRSRARSLAALDEHASARALIAQVLARMDTSRK